MGASFSSQSGRAAAAASRVSQPASASRNSPKIPQNAQSIPQHPSTPAEGESSQLLQNLKEIGQVKVDSQTWLRESQQMTHVIRTRAASEVAPVSKNTIDAIGLAQLFDARKRKRGDPSYVQNQTTEFDPKVVERLAKRYNSPSIGRENTLTLADGERRTYKEAVWTD